MATCLVVQHVEPEGAYVVGDALRATGSVVDLRRVYAGDALPPDAAELDGLVVMGGPMSATTDDGFPTRRRELELLADAVARGVPTLGVCLGAQLLAAAAGVSVRHGEAGAEIGWGTADLSGHAATDLLLAGLPARPTVLHWHGDTFDLPSGAVHLASSQRYANQAFRVGHRAWGFQFHVEVTQEAVAAFLRAFGDEARAGGCPPEVIAAATVASLQQLAPVGRRIAARFADLVDRFGREGDLVG